MNFRKWLALMALCIVASCGDSHDDSQLKVGGGIVFDGCSVAEQKKLNKAYGILLDTVSTKFAAYKSCMSSAKFMENNGKSGAQIADLLKQQNTTKVSCKNLEPNVNAEARLSISGEKLSADHSFIASSTELRIAAVMAHEIMHNRGFGHSTHALYNLYYGNTVPEQAEACISRGTPNAWPGVECSSNSQCRDELVCTTDVCVQPTANSKYKCVHRNTCGPQPGQPGGGRVEP